MCEACVNYMYFIITLIFNMALTLHTTFSSIYMNIPNKFQLCVDHTR